MLRGDGNGSGNRPVMSPDKPMFGGAEICWTGDRD